MLKTTIYRPVYLSNQYINLAGNKPVYAVGDFLLNQGKDCGVSSKFEKTYRNTGLFVATHIVNLDNVNRIEPLNQKYNHHDRPYSAQQSIARRYAGIYRNCFGCALWVG